MSKNSEFTVAEPEVSKAKNVAPAAAAPEATPEAPPAKPARVRQPLNGRSLKLQVFGEVPGYHLHIAKDEGARISLMQQAGYDFVKKTEIAGTGSDVASYNTDPGGNIRFVMGSNGAEPLYGYLMKIPEEFFEEDQAAMEAAVMAIDDQIRGGKVKETDDKSYVPKGAVQYQPQQPKFFKSKP